MSYSGETSLHQKHGICSGFILIRILEAHSHSKFKLNQLHHDSIETYIFKQNPKSHPQLWGRLISCCHNGSTYPTVLVTTHSKQHNIRNTSSNPCHFIILLKLSLNLDACIYYLWMHLNHGEPTNQYHILFTFDWAGAEPTHPIILVLSKL